MLLLRGEAPTRAWSPGDRLRLQQRRARAARPALRRRSAVPARGAGGGGAERARRRRRPERRATIRSRASPASGWRPRRGSPPSRSAAGTRMSAQAEAIVRAAASGSPTRSPRCEAALGPAWDRTLVIAMTEFGRTARENGSGGTDHGTGGAALLAGGAVAGGRVYGDWPGLGEGALYRGPRPDADDRRALLSGAGAGRALRPRPAADRARRLPRPRHGRGAEFIA